ncbi:ABC transporter related protein [Roseobacter sp. AzwK-3b]|nr:ABC transporter related protein [Roseobacter sp. AzwK-3b]
MLRLEAISAGYGKAQVLRAFSLDVAQGEIVCLLGRNGAGKTTAMKAAMGLLPLMGGACCWMARRSADGPPMRCRAPGWDISRRVGACSPG